MALAISAWAPFLVSCNIFYDVDSVRPNLPGEDAGHDSNSENDIGEDATLDTELDVVEDTAVDFGPTEDMSVVDADPDVAPDMPVCVPESNGDFCLRYVATCGNVSRVDNCGLVRNISCGTCAQGAFCSDNNCVETNCRNAMDDDGDGMSDCADADCDGQRCDMANSVCSGGECI